MKKLLSKWLVVYGVFLIFAGVTGYLSNPEKAKTALLSGGIFGAVSICLGILNARGFKWSWNVARGTLIFLAVTFLWRATVSWIAVADGQTEKIFAACLISLMMAATAAMLFAIFHQKSLMN